MTTRRFGRTSVLTCLALASPTTSFAQHQVHVGPERTISDIGEAVRLAPPEGLVLVDPGTYPAFQIDSRSVSILPASVPFTVMTDGTRPAITIRGLTERQTATIAGIRIDVAHGEHPPVLVADCAGSVFLERIALEPTCDLPNAAMRAVIDVRNTALAWFTRVDVWPCTPRNGTTTHPLTARTAHPDHSLRALIANESSIVLEDCLLRGYDDLAPGSGTRYGGDAVLLEARSTLRMQGPRTRLVGGNAIDFGGNVVHVIGTSPRLDVRACHLAPVSYVPGAGQVSGGYLAVNHDGGVVQSGPLSIGRYVPNCLVSATGRIHSELRARANSRHDIVVTSLDPRPYSLFAGIGRHPTMTVPALEHLPFLDPFAATTVHVHAGVLDRTLADRVTVAVPGVPELAGTRVTFQALLGPPLGQTQPAFAWTLPDFVVVTPG